MSKVTLAPFGPSFGGRHAFLQSRLYMAEQEGSKAEAAKLLEELQRARAEDTQEQTAVIQSGIREFFGARKGKWAYFGDVISAAEQACRRQSWCPKYEDVSAAFRTAAYIVRVDLTKAAVQCKPLTETSALERMLARRGWLTYELRQAVPAVPAAP